MHEYKIIDAKIVKSRAKHATRNEIIQSIMDKILKVVEDDEVYSTTYKVKESLSVKDINYICEEFTKNGYSITVNRRDAYDYLNNLLTVEFIISWEDA